MPFKFKVKTGTGTPVSGALDVGEFGYDTSTERLFIGNGSNDFATAIGGELMTERVYNNTGSQLNKLAAVYVSGAQGQRLTVALARANTDATSGKTFGLVYSAIANGDEGEVGVSGLIRGVNASGSQFSETWNQGDTIYLSPSTAGALTKVKPSAPGHLVTMGFVVNNSSTAGSIFIKVSNGFELNELHDVAISSPDAGHIIIYDNVAQLWENATITAGNAITITNGAGSISIAHTDTSSQGSVDNSGVDYIQDVTLDTYGHVTGLTSATIRDASGSQSGLVSTGTQTFAGAKSFSGSITLSASGPTDALVLNNNNITGVNNIIISDPGPDEGITWSGGNSWKIYESPNDLTTNTGGNLQIVQSTTRRATFNTSGQLEIPVATGTAPLVISSTTAVTNLNADLLDGLHSTSLSKRVDLSGQVQTASYRKSVIALCELTNTNPSANSYSIGMITFHRTNGLTSPVLMQIAMEKRYNVVGGNYTSFVQAGDSFGDNVQYIKFQYNGIWYGGIEFFFSDAELSQVTFHGESNFAIFGLDYYNTQTSTAINTEVNNSITTADMTAENDLFLNNNKVWTAQNDGSGSGLDADLLDGQHGSYYAPTAGPTFTGNATFDTNTLFVDATNDRVGIGTTSPAVKLHVAGGTRIVGVLNVMGDAETKRVWVDFEDGNDMGTIQVVQDGVSYKNLALQPDGSNVGIGTRTPIGKLDVQGSRTTAYSSTAIVEDFFRIRNLHNSAGSNQQAGISLSVSSDNGTSNGVVQLSAVAPTTGASTADFVIQTRNAGTTAERMRILANGNVGIGTASPNQLFEIKGSGLTYAKVSSATNTSFRGVGFGIENDATIYGSVAMEVNGGELRHTAGFTSWGGFETFYTNGAERMRITSTGNIGIGTTTPVSKLDVVDTFHITNSQNTQHGIMIENRATYYDSTGKAGIWSSSGAVTGPFSGQGAHLVIEGRKNSDRDIYIKVGDTTAASHVFKASGNVGINTLTPSEKLEVSGNIKHTGLVMTSGTNVDQLKTVTFTSALTTSWTDVTGVSGTDLATGSYIVQIESNGEYYTGTMSWFSGSTTSTVADEILLQRAGPAASAGRIFARVIRQSSSTLKLQVSGSTTIGSHTLTFKFRRTI